MDPREIDWERLDRYVAGEGTPEELEELRRWVESDPELQVVAEVMRTAQRRPGARPASWDAQGSWGAVAERLGLPKDPAAAGYAGAGHAGAGYASAERGEDGAARRRARGRTRPVLELASAAGARGWRAWRAAAAVAAAAVVMVFGADWWAARELARRGTAPVPSAAAGREYVTLRGQRLVVHLPDRTQITLAPESRLRLAPGYGRGRRDVDLVGQAYFVVAHDATRPFAVRTDRLIARDLGTRFVVRAYPADSVPDVVVAEGLVALAAASRVSGSKGAPADSLLLEPGDLGRVTTAGELVRRRGVPVEPYLAWSAGELVFRGMPLRDVVAELRRWYDIDVRLADPVTGAEQVTATFKDEPAEVVVTLVAAAAGLAVEQREGQFVLRRKRS